MSGAFTDLSPEGRMQKIREHVATGHPVPSYWVEWLLERMDKARGAVPATKTSRQRAAAVRERLGIGNMSDFFIAAAIEEAVIEEREACAVIAETVMASEIDQAGNGAANRIADAILARSNAQNEG